MICALLSKKWCSSSSSCAQITPVSTPSPDESTSVSELSDRTSESPQSPPPPDPGTQPFTVPLFSRECIYVYLRVLQCVLDLGYFTSQLLVESLVRRKDTAVLQYQHATILLVEVARGLFFLRRMLSQPTCGSHGDEPGRMKLACFLVYRVALELQEIYDSRGLTTVLGSFLSMGAFEFQCEYVIRFIPVFTSMCALSSPSANFEHMLVFLESAFQTEGDKYSRDVVDYLMFTVQQATFENALDAMLLLSSPRLYYECKLQEYRAGRIGKEMLTSYEACGCRHLIALVRHKYRRPLAHLIYLARDRVIFLNSASRVAKAVQCEAKDVETVHRFLKDHLRSVILSPSFLQVNSGLTRTKPLLHEPNPAVIKSIVRLLFAYPEKNDDQENSTELQPHATILQIIRFLERFIQASRNDGVDFKLGSIPQIPF